MPPVWLNILLDEKVVDKASILSKLKYEYTIDDVFDLIEVLDVQETVLKLQEKARSEQENSYANR